MSLNCFKLVAPGPKQWLEVQWLVDPPPYEPDFQRLQVWDITVVGVTPGDTVELGLLTGRGDPEVVAGLRADRRRGVAFRLNTVGLKHLAVSVDGTREETQVFAAGTFLEPILAIRRSGQRASTTVIGTGQAARIATALGGRVLVWDLERRLTGRIEIPGVRGVTAIAHGDLIAYTDTSVMRIGLTDGNVHVMTHRDLDSTITEVKDAAGTLVVRTEAKEEVVLDRTLVPINARAKRQDPAVTWNAEPWLSTPIRAGAVIARPLDGSVVIYRYLQPTVF
jgi:hypothetical protein